ncbi:MAG: substrate-binding domain-containing protein [Victivallales bacterium]
MKSSFLKKTTKQELLVSHFKSLIASGAYKAGDTIPPEMTLAKELGVNRTTVSKALTSLANAGILVRRQGSGTVVARDVNAASLHENAGEADPVQDATEIAIVASLFIEDPNFNRNPLTQILHGMEDSISRLLPNGRASFTNISPEASLDERLSTLLKSSSPAGLIYLSGYSMELTQRNVFALKKYGIPFVVASIDVRLPDADMVGISQTCFGFMAAEYLLKKGHRRLLYVVPDFNVPWLDERIEGFRRALSSAGMEFSADMILRYGRKLGCLPDQGMKEGREAGKIILEKYRDQTGIAAVNDSYAAGMLEVFRENGIEVPRRLSVVGADDHFHFRHLNITTIREPLMEVGAAAAEMLIGKISNERLRSRFELWRIKPRFVERSTTACPGS